MRNRLCLLAMLTCLVSPLWGFYLPGVTPVEYPMGSPVRIKVNSITSTKTAIPYDYYDLPFCLPWGKNPRPQVENFGEILWGDSIKPSPYITHMGVNITCRRVCPTNPSAKEMKRLKDRIEEGYRGQLIVDNLPVSEIFTQKIKGFRTFMLGYPLGTPKQPKTAFTPMVPKTQINNHLSLTIKYHKPSDFATAEKGYRIVGFHVMASSWNHDENSCQRDDSKNAGWYPRQGNPVTVDDTTIVYSYSVTWIEDTELAWSSRWDPYLSSAETDAKIHWFSIVNSLLIILFLSGMVAMIMLRALHKDFNRYNDPDNADEAQEETGWKLVHGDVFRKPPYPAMLATYIGTGCQLLGMAVITTIFALLGFLSPANRGGLLTAMLLLFILLGSYAGYVSARMCKMFRCQSWYNIFFTGTFYPGQVFGVFFFMDLTLWGMHASNAVPFTTLLALVGLWLCVSLPLVFVGAVVGYKRPVIEFPVDVNVIPRNIPEQRWYMKTPFTVLMAGILPFGAAFIELFFILSSLWLNRFYYVFGFLALVFLILIVTCAEITIVMVYFQLCYEDYRWWWRSFFISGSSGFHLFLYSIFYFATTLRMRKFWSTVIYFGWMLVISYTFTIITGTIGFVASFFFVHYIYGSIKETGYEQWVGIRVAIKLFFIFLLLRLNRFYNCCFGFLVLVSLMLMVNHAEINIEYFHNSGYLVDRILWMTVCQHPLGPRPFLSTTVPVHDSGLGPLTCTQGKCCKQQSVWTSSMVFKMHSLLSFQSFLSCRARLDNLQTTRTCLSLPEVAGRTIREGFPTPLRYASV